MLLLYQIYYNHFYSIFIIHWESESKQENLIAVLHILDHVSQVERKKGGRKKLKQIFQQKRKQPFLISGRKYMATQIQVIKFFIDNNLPNFVLN